jgi:Xaa-Pro aminopeptidase
MYTQRLERLREVMTERKIGTLIISNPVNRRYLSGFKTDDTQIGETAGFLIVSEKSSILVTDQRYAGLAQKEVRQCDIYVSKKSLFEEIAEILKEMPPPLAFEATHLSYNLYHNLKEILKNKGRPKKITPTRGLVECLRQIKEGVEIKLLKKALRLTEQVFSDLKTFLSPGITEKEVTWHIEKKIRSLMAELSFPPIVASGPNAAIPHAVPTKRGLRSYEPIIIDCGVRWNGYCADMTRTFYLGKAKPKFKKIYNMVAEAKEQAITAIRAGLKTYEADAIVRRFFKEKGLEKAFLHSLGHGVGLLVHEAPTISPRQPGEELKNNMVITIEPGLYFPGWGGIRLEDMVLIKKNGCRYL